MIYCRMKELIAEKERKEKRPITYRTITNEIGLSSATIVKLTSYNGIKRIDSGTLELLCNYFDCSVGEVLVKVANR